MSFVSHVPWGGAIFRLHIGAHNNIMPRQVPWEVLLVSATGMVGVQHFLSPIYAYPNGPNFDGEFKYGQQETVKMLVASLHRAH